MINNDQKTSLLVPLQLPEYVRENPDYANFVTFVQAYYEWMEQSGQVTEGSKNLLSYADIDRTTDAFLEFYTKEFIPYLPEDALISKQSAVKIARQLYQSKGVPQSYKFLFRVLYNSDFDLFLTKDAVLKASDGQWYVPKSLKLSTNDPNFLNIKNLRVFGETSKSFAVVENSVLSGTKTEVFISNIERLFQSGEIIRVVDNNNQPVLFNGNMLRAKLVGQISQVNIDKNNRGSLYQPGDPVIIYNGLNSSNGIGATAEVGTTTAGSIKSISVTKGGFGYTASPNTLINITNGGGATAHVASLNPNLALEANVSLIPIDTISLKRNITIGNTNYHFANIAVSNANTSLANAFTFLSFSTFPISSVIVDLPGSGIITTPTVSAESTYNTDIGIADLGSLGILAPIQISSGGLGYVANDQIIFSGGDGYGAHANVINVAANGAITSVQYVYYKNENPHHHPLGGMGYKATNLPVLTISSANSQASGASLFVPGILGQGATFDVVTDRAGTVTTINLDYPGEDYVSTPNVSLKVQDIVVSNVNILNLPKKGDTVYQGANINVSTYQATINSVSLLQPFNDPTQSLYNLRVFNYNSNPNPTLPLKTSSNLVLNMANTAFNSNYNANGIKNYGDGTAKATASFKNGLLIGQGQYLNTRGQPSSFSVLQSDKYNNFTYQITVEKEISKYRDVLLSLLHPAGMKLLGRYALKSGIKFDYHSQQSLYQGIPLADYTGYPASNVSMTTNFTTKSTNVINFGNLAGANIATFISNTSTIEITPTNGPNVRCEVVSVNSAANTVTLKNNTWLTYANVAYATGINGTNTINITSLTGAYDIINNGQYSDTNHPLKDIVFAGDTVLIANNSSASVKSVDYINGIITLNTNLTANANSLLSVNRTFNTTQVRIFGPIGVQYIPQLTDENGNILITEDGTILLLG